MSKVECQDAVGLDALDCGHNVELDFVALNLEDVYEGTEVDCPVCAEIKAARLDELWGISLAVNLIPANRIETVLEHLTTRIAELEAQ